MSRQFTYEKDEFIFKAPSRKKNKKYDAHDARTGDYVTSFGDSRYQQYRDRIGHYSGKDHENQRRRKSYYARHGRLSTYLTPKFFSHKYLW